MGQPDSGTVRVRYAPSPTGKPHVGNIRTALYNWLFARHHGGQFIFRLEDTDQERYDPEAEGALYEALRWLGLDWNEGPDCGGPHSPYQQSQRLDIYRGIADELIASGAAYPCFCSRERVSQVRQARREANLHPYGYDRHCRALCREDADRRVAAGEPHVVRFAIPLEGATTFEDEVRGRITHQNRELDDHVLLKSDGFPTYQMANVVDDHLMGITHVIRAEEWIPSTPRHVLLYQALGWTPPRFAHLSLIVNSQRKKLSKRDGEVDVGEYARRGYLPEAMANFLALLGWAPGEDREIMSLEEMVELFTLDRVNVSPSVFDLDKLEWMNGLYIRQLSPDDLVARTLPLLQDAGLVSSDLDNGERAYVSQVLLLEQERIKRLDEAPELTEFFFQDTLEYDPKGVRKWLSPPVAKPILERLLQRLEELPEWTGESLEAAIRGCAEDLDVKAAEVIHRARVSTTGRTRGPGLFETLTVLGRERVIQRIKTAMERFLSD